MPEQQSTPLVFRQSPLRLAAQSFYLSREAERCTPATLRWYKQYITALVDYLHAHKVTDVKDVTPDHLRAFLVFLQRRNLSDTSIHHHASAARTFFNYCAAEGLLTDSPMRTVKMPHRDKKILPAFTSEDMQNIVAACKSSDRDLAIVLCLLDTGCRASEFVALNVGDVSVKTGAVKIRAGKGRKDRVTFLGAKARKALIKYLMARPDAASTEALWLGRTRKRFTIWGLEQLLERIGKQAGVEGVTPHKFRRTCALWSLRSGMSIYALQQIMGHADLTVLRRYLDLVEQDLAEAHKKSGPVDSLL